MWVLERFSAIPVSFSSTAFLSLYPYISLGYKERKAVELKLTGIALNRSKTHIGERTTDRGLQVGFFLLKTRSHF